MVLELLGNVAGTAEGAECGRAPGRGVRVRAEGVDAIRAVAGEVPDLYATRGPFLW